MHKVLYKPICHFNHQQAIQILEQLRYTGEQRTQLTPINRPQSLLVLNNNPVAQRNQSRNMRMPSLQTLSNPHYQNQNLNNINSNTAVEDSNQKSKVSIFGNYKQFINQKDNFQRLKQQNSRLHFQRLALQSSLNKLKEDNIRKDEQILRLKQLVNLNKVPQGIMENKNLNAGGFIQPNNRNHQVNFFSTFQTQRRPF